MRKMKTITVPVVTGALGLVKKGMEKYTQKIPGNIKNSRATKYHSSWNVPHPKESTMYQIDFYMLVSPRPKKWVQLLRWY